MDNERPIEKLLRRYAKKRRDDPAAKGLELHPATRRMLQGEVARQFEVRGHVSGSSPDPSRLTPRTLTNLWPRLVWGLPVVVALGVGVWVIVQSRKAQQSFGDLAKVESPSPLQSRESLARTETRVQSASGVTPPGETAPTTLAEADASRAKDVPSLGLEEGKLKADRAASLALNTPAPNVVANDALVPEAANLGKEVALADRQALARDARVDKSRDLTAQRAEEADGFREKAGSVRAVPASPAGNPGPAPSLGGTPGRNRSAAPLSAAPPSAAAPPLSLSDKSPPTKSEDGRVQIPTPTVVQKFVQTTAISTSNSLAKKSAETPSVLETFQVEQTGNQLRVIDSDGSSYNGSIQSTAASASYGTTDESKRTGDAKNTRLYLQVAGQKDQESQAGQNYFFSVAGTNRTLKQPVAFTGNLLVLTSATNALPAPQLGVTLAPAAKSRFPQEQSGLPTLLNSTISGKVQLGAEKEMEIRAVPVAR